MRFLECPSCGKKLDSLFSFVFMPFARFSTSKIHPACGYKIKMNVRNCTIFYLLPIMIAFLIDSLFGDPVEKNPYFTSLWLLFGFLLSMTFINKIKLRAYQPVKVTKENGLLK